jgi:hypothetical protein
MIRLRLALVVIALLAGPAAAERGKPPPRRERPKPAKPVKPDVTAPAPAPEPEAPKPEAAKPAAAKPAAKAGDAAHRESRIEFDERMVQGQTAAGAIYLFQRADAAFSSMIAPPVSFRERTIRTVYVDGVPGSGGTRP